MRMPFFFWAWRCEQIIVRTMFDMAFPKEKKRFNLLFLRANFGTHEYILHREKKKISN